MKHITVTVAGAVIGHGQPIVPQSMCNTDTNDIEATYRQIVALKSVGFRMVRVTTQGLKEVESLRLIKERLRQNNIDIPLIADVHFSSDVALAAARVADKVRINPGNFDKDFIKAKSKLIELIAICKRYGTALRIGLNHGSLGERITNLYGNTAQAMKEALVEWMDICIQEKFDQVVFSLKASNTYIMSRAYELFYEEMCQRGVIFPLHLGVTEAGNGDMGRIKSATGVSTLLRNGIGETIRVSLTEDPEHEYDPCRLIIEYFQENISYEIIEKREEKKRYYRFDVTNHQEFIIKASCEIGPLLLDHTIDNFEIDLSIKGKAVDSTLIDDFHNNLMQAARRKFLKPEYIACPGCGRTLFNIEKVFNEVQQKTSHLKGMTIAVMGCIVNGPGEMADADWGYIGEGRGKVSIYKGGQPLLRSIPEEQAIDLLLNLIGSDK